MSFNGFGRIAVGNYAPVDLDEIDLYKNKERLHLLISEQEVGSEEYFRLIELLESTNDKIRGELK